MSKQKQIVDIDDYTTSDDADVLMGISSKKASNPNIRLENRQGIATNRRLSSNSSSDKDMRESLRREQDLTIEQAKKSNSNVWYIALVLSLTINAILVYLTLKH